MTARRPAYMKLNSELIDQAQALPEAQRPKFVYAAVIFFFTGEPPKKLPKEAALMFEANRTMLEKWRRSVLNGARNSRNSSEVFPENSVNFQEEICTEHDQLAAETQIPGTHLTGNHNKQITSNYSELSAGALRTPDESEGETHKRESESTTTSLVRGLTSAIVENSRTSAAPPRTEGAARQDSGAGAVTFEQFSEVARMLEGGAELTEAQKRTYHEGHPRFIVQYLDGRRSA